VLNYKGIRYGDLSSAQHDRLLALVDYHVGRMRDGHAQVKMEEVKRHLQDTIFAGWAAWRTTARFITACRAR
jgi:hypothetical protein